MTAAQPITVIFMGSFQHYSAHILAGLIKTPQIKVLGVITTPATPDKKGELHPNPVQELAQTSQLPVLTPATLDENTLLEIETQLGKPDILLTAGYGKLLPATFLDFPQVKALNLHFSLLPSYRGANPGEYALLNNEKMTGITLMEMDQSFDTGHILQQAELEIEPNDTRISLYEKLYLLGKELIGDWINQYLNQQITPSHQDANSPTLYAKKLTKEDGFLAWSDLKKLIMGEKIAVSRFSLQIQKILTFQGQEQVAATFVERMSRALYQYPTLWTKIPTSKGERRMIIWQTQIEKTASDEEKLKLSTVQIAGQNQAHFNQIKNMILD